MHGGKQRDGLILVDCVYIQKVTTLLSLLSLPGTVSSEDEARGASVVPLKCRRSPATAV